MGPKPVDIMAHLTSAPLHTQLLLRSILKQAKYWVFVNRKNNF